MMKFMRERLNKDEGFTLVELMVVVLIIAILIAIAIPTFLGARERAQDRAAQSNLRNALTAAKVHYTDTENFSDGAAVLGDVTAAQLLAIEPSLNFGASSGVAATAAAADVAWEVEHNSAASDYQIITFTTFSASGRSFGVSDVTTIGTYGSGTTYCMDETAAPTGLFLRAGCAMSEW